MRKLLTTICCVSLAFIGYTLTFGGKIKASNDQNALHAATTLNWGLEGLKPVNVQLQENNLKDTVYVTVHDTVLVNNTKYVRVPVPQHTTDTLYIPAECNHSADTVFVNNPKQEKTVLLTVDGKVVYDSGNTDGLREP